MGAGALVLVLPAGAVPHAVTDQVRGYAEAGHTADELGLVVADRTWNKIYIYTFICKSIDLCNILLLPTKVYLVKFDISIFQAVLSPYLCRLVKEFSYDSLKLIKKF